MSQPAAERCDSLRKLSARIEVRDSVVQQHQLTLEEMRRVSRGRRHEVDAAPEPEPEPEPDPEAEPAVTAWHSCVAAVGAERGGSWGQQHRVLARLYSDALGQPDRNPTPIMLDAGARDTFPLRPVSVSQWRFLCAALSLKYQLPDPEQVEAYLNVVCGGNQHPEWAVVKRELRASIADPVPSNLVDSRSVSDQTLPVKEDALVARLADPTAVSKHPPPAKKDGNLCARLLLRRWRRPTIATDTTHGFRGNPGFGDGELSPLNSPDIRSKGALPLDALIACLRQENELLRSRARLKLEEDASRLTAAQAATRESLARREHAARWLESSLQRMSDHCLVGKTAVRPRVAELAAEREALAELRLRLLRQCAATPLPALEAELARVDGLWKQHKHERALELVDAAQGMFAQEKINTALDRLAEADSTLESFGAELDATVPDWVRSTRALIADTRRRAEQLSTLQREEARGDAARKSSRQCANNGLTEARKHYDASVRAVCLPDDLRRSPEREAVERVFCLVKLVRHFVKTGSRCTFCKICVHGFTFQTPFRSTCMIAIPVTGQVQKKHAEVLSLIRAESEWIRSALVRQMAAAAASAARLIAAADKRGAADTRVDMFSTVVNHGDAIALAQALYDEYQKGANLCTGALALDPARSNWTARERTELEVLLILAQRKARVQELVCRARMEMASGKFSQAVETLTDAMDASAQVDMHAATADYDTMASATLIVPASQHQIGHRIAALRALAAKRAAETDLCKRGVAAMLQTRKPLHQRAALLDSVSLHEPHPYWNPSEAERRELHDARIRLNGPTKTEPSLDREFL